MGKQLPSWANRTRHPSAKLQQAHRLRNVALFTADGLNEESLINTARALKALGIDPQRVVIDNEEVEL